MKNIIIILLLIPVMCVSQYDFKTQILIKNDMVTLDKPFFGINKNATDLLDNDINIGEYEIPNLSPFTEMAAGFVIKKIGLFDTTELESIYSYKDIRPYFKTDKDSIIYNLKIVYPTSNVTMWFGTIPDFVKSAKLIQKYYPYDTFNIESNGIIKLPYNQALISYSFDIVIKNYYDQGDIVEENNDFLVYPNPAANYIYLSKELCENLNICREVNIIDASGKIISKEVLNGAVDVSDLAKGNYILTGKNKKNRTFRKKIIKI